ncbi:hypothetical protein [Niabella hirudinis]|uniref:hypothetical protein n=1 Tax=Niabella hirudinis TaxID=1285929 RepID=UPI003EBB042B
MIHYKYLLKRLFNLTCCCLLLPLFLKAQYGSGVPEPKCYIGLQAGAPLFWGDITSVGKKTYPGAAIGIAGGYRFGKWLAAELDADYGAGILGASEWQVNDYIDNNGVLQYTKGSWTLGSVYSRTRFISLGLRLPVRLFALLRPSKDRVVDLELAPRFSFNHFTPEIFDLRSYGKLTEGAAPQKWVYAAGGDAGVAVKLDRKAKVYLRSALSWISDERFEGISTRPAWRVNLLLYTTAGVQFDIGRAKN